VKSSLVLCDAQTCSSSFLFRVMICCVSVFLFIMKKKTITYTNIKDKRQKKRRRPMCIEWQTISHIHTRANTKTQKLELNIGCRRGSCTFCWL